MTLITNHVLRPRHVSLLVASALLGCAVVVTWPLAVCAGACLPGNLGDPLLNAWIIGWGAERMLDGLSSFWNVPIFFPYEGALSHSEHLLGITVLVAPLYWLTGNAVLTYDAAFFLAFALAGWGAYSLVRALTSRRDVALAAACVFMCVPYLSVSQVSRLQVLHCGWMGFALSGLHHYFKERTTWRLVQFAVAYTMLSLSNTYYAFFFTVPTASIVALGLWQDRPRWRTHVLALAVTAAGIGLALVPVGVAYQRAQETMDISRSIAEIEPYSANVLSYGRVWHESALSRWLPGESTSERALFPGLALSALALLVGWQAWRGRSAAEATAYAAAGLVAFILSLGPRPMLGTWPIVATGPYEWLMMLVPGFDALRAPARLGIIVLLALTVIGSLGLARATARLSVGRRHALMALLAALALGEALATPVPLTPFEAYGRRQDRPVDEWLSHQEPGPVLALPIAIENFAELPSGGVTQALLYQFGTLHHGNPLVNGSSGVNPPLVEWFEGEGSPFGEMPGSIPGLLDMLRELGVRYVVVHADDYRAPTLADTVVAGIGALDDHVKRKASFGQKHVFELHPRSDLDLVIASGGHVETDDFQVVSSQEHAAARFLNDDDPATRWQTGTVQSGDEWVALEFPRPTPVAAIRLTLGPEGLFDYPRRLEVWSVTSGQEVKLFDGHVLDLLVRAILRSPTEIAVTLRLPPNLTKTLRIKQTGRTDWPWSMAEVDVLRDPAS